MQYVYSNYMRENRPRGTLSVNGYGYVEASPDIALLSAGVTTYDKDVKIAQFKNTAIVNSIIDSLINFGISESNISSNDISINIVYDPSTNQLKGYEITTIISITTDKIDNLGNIYSLFIDNDANSNINLSFKLSDINPYYSQALSLATKDALHKAELLATNLGLKLCNLPKEVIEVSSQQIFTTTKFDYSTLGASPNILPQDLNVSANVNVIFTTYL